MKYGMNSQRLGFSAIVMALLLVGSTSVRAAAPDLNVSITDALTSINAGATMIYTITIKNQGTADSSGIKVTANIPSNCYFIAYSSTPAGTVSGSNVVFPAFNLAKGATTTRQFKLGLTNPTPGSPNTAAVTANAVDDGTHGADLDPTNNSACDTDTVNDVPAVCNDLAITITDGLTEIYPCATMLYTLTITQNGNITSNNTWVRALIPANTTFVSANNGGFVQNGYVVFPLFSLASHATTTRQFTLALTCNLPVPAPTTLCVTGQVSNDQAECHLDDNCATDCDVVKENVCCVDLAICVDDHVTCATPCNKLTYDITISNIGTMDAQGVIVKAFLPPGVSFDSASDSGSFSNGVVSWGGALNPNEVVHLTLVVKVDCPLAANITSIALRTTISYDNSFGIECDQSNNTATDTDTICIPNNPDLSIVVTDDLTNNCISPNDTVVFTVKTCNIGNVVTTGVVINATLPANTTFVSASNGGLLNGTTVVYPTLASLATGACVTYTFTAKVIGAIPAGVTTIGTTATVHDDGAHGAEVNLANNTASDIIPVCPPKYIDLTITVTDNLNNNCVDLNNSVTFTVKACNIGNVTSTGVVITALVPPNTTFTSASDGGLLNGSNVVYPTIPALAPNACVTYTYTVKVNGVVPAGTTTIGTTVSVTDDKAHGDDVNLANNTASDIVPLCPPKFVDLTITVADDLNNNCVELNNSVTFTIHACNVGNIAATGVVITAAIPANTTFTSAGNGGAVAGTNVVYPTIASLAAGACVDYTFTAKVNGTVPAGVTTIDTTVTVHDDATHGADANPANNTATDVVPLCPPPPPPPVDLTILVTDEVTCVSIGNNVVFTIKACNIGKNTATGVVIAAAVPANSSYVSSTNGGVLVGSQIQYPTIASMAPGECVTYTFTVLLPKVMPPGVTTIDTTVTVTDDKTHGDDANPADNTATDSVPVCPAPDLQITQDSSPVCFAPGAQITYTLAVKNLVLGAASGVVVTDTLPADVTFVSASDGAVFAAGVVTFPAFDLAVNVTAIRTIVVSVNAGLVGNVTLVNTASVDDDHKNGADTNAANNSAVRNDCVTGNTPPCVTPPSIISGPTATPTPIIAGSEETYTVAVSDNGTGKGVTVTWDFGDGTPTVTGETVKHTYAAGGSFTVTVTAANECGAVGQTLNAATGGRPNPFTCQLLRAPLNLKKKSSDALSFIAQIPTAPGFSPAGKKIGFNMSNFTWSGTLDKKGRFKDARHQIQVKSFGSNSALITLKVTKENLMSSLAPGVNASSSAATLPGQRYLINLDGTYYGQNMDLNFVGEKGKGMITK